jgi:hypothetical protein
MHLAQDNDVVHTFTPDRSDQPFGSLRLNTIYWSTAFSASSRNFDLNGEASTARTKQSSPIIRPAQAIPSRHQLG